MKQEHKCYHCKEIKPINDFSKDRTNFWGHNGTCKKCHAIQAKGWASKNQHILNKAKEEWQQRNPEKKQAHVEVFCALKRGDLVKQPCEICGDKKVHAHHDDYLKPLEVRWLCTKHHEEHHRKIINP